MENRIVIMHNAVPSFDYSLIHFFDGTERSRTVINYPAMVEMRIRNEENRHTNSPNKMGGMIAALKQSDYEFTWLTSRINPVTNFPTSLPYQTR